MQTTLKESRLDYFEVMRFNVWYLHACCIDFVISLVLCELKNEMSILIKCVMNYKIESSFHVRHESLLFIVVVLLCLGCIHLYWKIVLVALNNWLLVVHIFIWVS